LEPRATGDCGTPVKSTAGVILSGALGLSANVGPILLTDLLIDLDRYTFPV